MFLHLGYETVIRKKDIIGIFDIDTATVTKNTRDYLFRKEKEGRCITVSYELPGSFVVCADKDGNETVYISRLSAATLLKRTEEVF
ncbi:MAG: DUF370 domain-containing protein [Clostridia bacterium]|nr:DUF370 domain-containing protein [Clostridia bacterium]